MSEQNKKENEAANSIEGKDINNQLKSKIDIGIELQSKEEDKAKSQEKESIKLFIRKEQDKELKKFLFQDLSLDNVEIYAENEQEAEKLKPLAKELDSFMKEIGGMDEKDSKNFMEYFKKKLIEKGIGFEEKDGVLTIKLENEADIGKLKDIAEECKKYAQGFNKGRTLPDEMKKSDKEKENLIMLLGNSEQGQDYKLFMWGGPDNDVMISVADEKEAGNTKTSVASNVMAYAQSEEEAEKLKPAVKELSSFIEELKKAQEEGLSDDSKKLRECFQEDLEKSGIGVKKTENGPLIIYVKDEKDMAKLQEIAAKYKDHAKTLNKDGKLPTEIQNRIAEKKSIEIIETSEVEANKTRNNLIK